METRRGAEGSIARPAGTVAFFTFLSRVFGLVRDVVVAFRFGAGAHADAFFVAFRIPNLLRRLVAEGAMTASFLPVYVEYLERRDPEDAERVASVIFTGLLVVLTGLTLLGIIGSSSIIQVFAPGFLSVPGKFDLTVLLNRIVFPYIFFASLVALCMGILNARGHFAAPAASPILLNVFMIAGALVFSRWCNPPILGLAVGVLLGGGAQLLLQIPALRAREVRLRPCFAWRDPAVGRIARLFLPAAFGAAVYQLNLFVSNLLASFLPEGSISYLWYASRLLEFPLGVFGVALATAAFPRMSLESARNRMEPLRNVLDRTLGMMAWICLPCTVGLVLLRVPILEVLFQRGAFDPAVTQRTAEALLYYSLGLFPIAAGRILVTAFHAVQDTSTPVKVSLVAFVANVVLSLLLMGPMLHAGLALANSAAAVLNLCLLLILFRKKAGPCGLAWARDSGIKVVASSCVMGCFLLGVNHWVGVGQELVFWRGLIQVAVGVFGGAAVYLGVCRALGVPELREFSTHFLRRGRTAV